jgi:SAM-dependent methyltransferase
MLASVRDAILRILGWRLLLVTGDPCVLDRWLWLRRQLRSGPLRTLDAGAGNGAFSMYAARVGNRVVAASFSADELEQARSRAAALGVGGIDFRVLDLRELDARRASLGTFDQIVCLETIEHLRDDAGLVEGLAQMLEPGGRLLLTTPFDGHRPLYTEEQHPSPVEDGSHVRYGYSTRRLWDIAVGAGLQVQSEAFVSGFVSQKLTNLMRRLTERVGLLPAWLVVAPLRLGVILDAPLSRTLRYPYLSVALCAVRPPRVGEPPPARRGERSSAPA